MAKRFTDTDKYKKSFIRSLPGAYKLLWDYLYHDCNHAGIWHVDFEVAQIMIGKDMPVDYDTALQLFNKDEQRIVSFDNGSKWFIKPFIEFQYGELNPENRAHASVISILVPHKLISTKDENKPLASTLHGAMDKDKDKDKDKEIKKGDARGKQNIPDWVPEPEWLAYVEMRKKIRKPMTQHAMDQAIEKLKVLKNGGHDISAILNQSIFNSWAGLFEIKTDFQKKGGGNYKTAGNMEAVKKFNERLANEKL